MSQAPWKWFHSARIPNRGVVLLIHGLNLAPARLDTLANALSALGYEVLRPSLSGHRGDLEKFRAANRGDWLDEIHRAYEEAQGASLRQSLPLHFIGYSMGALLNLDLMHTRKSAGIAYEKMVLLAPALALTAPSLLVRALGFLPSSLVVPSLSDPAYRAHPQGTPLAGYRAVLDSLSRLEATDYSLAHIPTLVAIDPKDELVSASGLKKLIERRNLGSHWSWMEMPKEKGFHHHIVDEEGLGATLWGTMVQAIGKHLG